MNATRMLKADRDRGSASAHVWRKDYLKGGKKCQVCGKAQQDRLLFRVKDDVERLD